MSLTNRNNEQYLQEMQEIKPNTEEPNSPYYELIGKLMRRELTLSYTKLKNLTSPINFINAILNPKEKNKGMTLGSIVDCLLLTEQNFNSQFEVVKNAPTTEKQTEFVNLVLDKMKLEGLENFDKKFEEAKEEGFQRVKTDDLKDYILALLQGKECISEDMYEKAKIITENLRNTDEVADELAQVDEFQKKVEFTYKGWNFIGYLDTFHSKGFHDLKFASDCNPDKFGRDIENFGYDIQFGIYAIAMEVLYGIEFPSVKHIIYDALGNYAVIEIDQGYIGYAKRKIDFLIACLEKMIRENGYTKSYSFFRKNNIVFKPQWVKGFDHSIF